MSIFDVFKKPAAPQVESEVEIIKYDSPIYFIPEDIKFKLSSKMVERIKSLLGYKNDISFEDNDTVQFADSGENFETVNCPYCKADLMECWGEAMDLFFELHLSLRELKI